MRIATVLLPVGLGISLACAADKPGVDSLTQLPVPLTDGAFSVGGTPRKMDPFTLCKSTVKTNYYSASSGKVATAVAWYNSHLSGGFKHTSGYSSGRSHDTFYNAAGTQIVAITGNAARQGENADVYAVIYGALQPAAREKEIVGMNVANIDCR